MSLSLAIPFFSKDIFWANPEAFWLFIPLVLGVFFYYKIAVKHRSRLPFPFDWSATKGKNPVITPFKMGILLRTIALSCMVIALARPQKREEKEKRIVEAVDLLLVFDLSKSMEALDFSPNRRHVAIEALSKFINRRIDDRIGLVLFSGEAYLSVPLTMDHNMLIKSLEQSSNAGLEDGTAIGQALAVGVNHLRHSTAKSRVILLVTDGDNNMGSVDPISAANLAAGFGLRIYTIGLGKKGRVPYPVYVTDAYGQKRQMLQYLTDAVNDELLQKIADTTGGRFFSATDQNLLTKIYDDIDKLEKSKVEILKQIKVSELADLWIWLCVSFLLIEGLLLQSIRRKFP